jgi:hypothetical protein
MNKYPSDNYTWGMEIEWGDIPRSFIIPEHLGSWEYAETDIVNLREPYKNVCCDPQGIEPPVGGEINTRPTKTWEEQVDRYFELQRLFQDNGTPPTISATSHAHIHCFVPGLKEDIASLKRLVAYIKENQREAVDYVYGFFENNEMRSVKGAKMYLKFDGGRLMPDYMCDNIINLPEDFDRFVKLHAAGKDGVSMGRPFRYAINTYSMKHIGTIEFRFFRSTLDRDELSSCFRFAKDFIDSALNSGPSVRQLFLDNNYIFPKMVWDLAQFRGWEKTRYGKERGKKERKYIEVV